MMSIGFSVPIDQGVEPIPAGVVLAAGVVGPASDVGIGGSGSIRCSKPAGGRGHGWSAEATGGLVEQAYSASVEARAASRKAFDFTGVFLRLGLTGLCRVGETLLKKIGTHLGVLNALQRSLGDQAQALGFFGSQLGDRHRATLTFLAAPDMPAHPRGE